MNLSFNRAVCRSRCARAYSIGWFAIRQKPGEPGGYPRKNCHPSFDGWQHISAKRPSLSVLLHRQSYAFAVASTKTAFAFFLLPPRKKIAP
jgi:hypothetical protein